MSSLRIYYKSLRKEQFWERPKQQFLDACGAMNIIVDLFIRCCSISITDLSPHSRIISWICGEAEGQQILFNSDDVLSLTRFDPYSLLLSSIAPAPPRSSLSLYHTVQKINTSLADGFPSSKAKHTNRCASDDTCVGRLNECGVEPVWLIEISPSKITYTSNVFLKRL